MGRRDGEACSFEANVLDALENRFDFVWSHILEAILTLGFHVQEGVYEFGRCFDSGIGSHTADWIRL